MEEIVTIIVAMGALVLMVDQVRKLIGHFIINRTIGKALDKAPDTVPLLIAKIEDPKPWPVSPFGWLAVALGVALSVSLALSANAKPDDIGIAAGLALFGVMLLVSHYGNVVRTEREKSNPPAQP